MAHPFCVVTRRFTVSPSRGEGWRRASNQQQIRHLLLGERRYRSPARAQQNDLPQATGVHVSDQTVRNSLTEGGMMAQRPLVGHVLTAQHPAARLAFTREHRNCSPHRWEQVHTKHTGVKECTNTMANVMLPVTSSSMTVGQFGLGRQAVLHVIANSTLTAVMYQDEIPKSNCQTLCWCIEPWAPPGTGQCPALCGQSVWSVPVWRRHWRHWLALSFPWPKLSAYRTLCIGAFDVAEFKQRLFRSSLMSWSRSGRRSHWTPSVHGVRSPYKDARAIHTTESHYELSC